MTMISSFMLSKTNNTNKNSNSFKYNIMTRNY